MLLQNHFKCTGEARRMTVRTFYPPAIYRFLFDIAFKYKLSIKEVETVFLRRQARELSFECFHENVKSAKTDGKPFCKDCWTRLEQSKPPVIGPDKRIKIPGKYRPLKTFLDEIEEERIRRAAIANPTPLPNEQE
jgi:hypothetical protein